MSLILPAGKTINSSSKWKGSSSWKATVDSIEHEKPGSSTSAYIHLKQWFLTNCDYIAQGTYVRRYFCLSQLGRCHWHPPP